MLKKFQPGSRNLPVHFVGGCWLLILGGMGCKQGRNDIDPHAQPLGKISQTSTASNPLATIESFIGVILYGDAIDVVPHIEGQVESMYVKLGDHVLPGQRLALITSRENKNKLSMSMALLSEAKAQQEKVKQELIQAQSQLKRRSNLAAVLSKEELESAQVKVQLLKSEHEIAQARVVEREARVGQLVEKIEDETVKAPFAGNISLIYISRGAMLRAGQPICRLLSKKGVRVRFAVPPERIATVSLNQTIHIAIPSMPIKILKGKITHISEEVDLAAQMVFYEGSIDFSHQGLGQLKDGLMVHVRVVPNP